jgi:hypothetical protein
MWRVNTSSTQARQIPFSNAATDSGGKADKSSGLIFLAGFFFGAADFFGRFAGDLTRFAGMAATTPSET